MDGSPHFPDKCLSPINLELNLDEMATAIVREHLLESNNLAPTFRSFRTPTATFVTSLMSNLNLEKEESTLMNLVGYVTTIFIPSGARKQVKTKAVVQQAPGSDPLEPGYILRKRMDGGKINDITGYDIIGVIDQVWKDNNRLKYKLVLDNKDIRIGSPVYRLRPRPR